MPASGIFHPVYMQYTELGAKMSVDPKSVELTADVLQHICSLLIIPWWRFFFFFFLARADYRFFERGLNPFRAPEPLPILNPSNLSPKTGFQL